MVAATEVAHSEMLQPRAFESNRDSKQKNKNEEGRQLEKKRALRGEDPKYPSNDSGRLARL